MQGSLKERNREPLRKATYWISKLHKAAILKSTQGGNTLVQKMEKESFNLSHCTGSLSSNGSGSSARATCCGHNCTIHMIVQCFWVKDWTGQHDFYDWPTSPCLLPALGKRLLHFCWCFGARGLVELLFFAGDTQINSLCISRNKVLLLSLGQSEVPNFTQSIL